MQHNNAPPVAGGNNGGAAPDASAPMAGSVYEIEPRHAPGLRVDVSGAGSSNGTKIHMWGRNSSKAQQFKVHAVNGGHYVFEPLCAPGMAIDNHGAAKQPCHLWDTENNSNQNTHFKLEPTGGGYFAVIARTHGGHRWDVEGAKQSEGGKLCTWSNDEGNTEHRQFKFNLVGDASAPMAGSVYEIEPRHAPGLRVDVDGAGSSNVTYATV